MLTKPNLSSSDWLNLIGQVSQTPPAPEPLAQTRVAIANPPFGKINVGYLDMTNYALAYGWKKQGETLVQGGQLKSAVDGEAIFTELCVRQLQPGEITVLLIPNGLLGAPGMQYAREWIKSECQLLASIQLPQEAWKVECSLSLTTSLIVLRRNPENYQGEDYNIFMAVLKKVGYDSRRKRLYKLDKQGKRTDQVDDELPEIERGFTKFLEAQ
jgi:type I restriction enzyme M protein